MCNATLKRKHLTTHNGSIIEIWGNPWQWLEILIWSYVMAVSCILMKTRCIEKNVIRILFEKEKSKGCQMRSSKAIHWYWRLNFHRLFQKLVWYNSIKSRAAIILLIYIIWMTLILCIFNALPIWNIFCKSYDQRTYLIKFLQRRKFEIEFAQRWILQSKI